MSDMKCEKAKRLAIYATFDKNGIIDDYILYCLNELCNVADDLAVVSNNKLPAPEKCKLTMASWVYERNDSGYDMGGFAHVINSLASQGQLEKYDEIIFMNDSVFGPFYPFSDMFLKMDGMEELDFWGITKRGVSDFDGGDQIYPEHIQLYFYVVKKRMAHSHDFSEYWRKITEKVTDFRSAILNYEFAFTQYFADRGYKWEVYCHTGDLITDNPKFNLSPYHYCSYDLIKEEKCPVLKRKLFTGDFIEGRFCDESDLRKAISYIAENTDYDIDLIWSHVLRIYNVKDIIKSMKMLEVIDVENDSFENNTCVRIIDNLGTVIKDDFVNPDKGEYTVFISLERNAKTPATVFWAERDCIIENLLCSRTYIEKVGELFKMYPRLGVVVPPVQTFGKISDSLGEKWKNEKIAIEIAGKYGLSVPIGQEAPIHKINAFGCRSSLLQNDLLNDLKSDRTGTIMQMLPLFAQQKGYYTEIVINKNYAARLLMNMWQITQDIWELYGGDAKAGMNLDMEEIHDSMYFQKIKDFVKGKNKLYIYGAGQLACRVIKMIENFRKPDGIVVSDKNGNADNVCGYPVCEIGEINARDGSFIVAVGKKNNSAVGKILEAAGVGDCLLLV